MPIDVARDLSEAVQTVEALGGNGFELTVWAHRCNARGDQALRVRILPSQFDRCSTCGELSPARQARIDAQSASVLRGGTSA